MANFAQPSVLNRFVPTFFIKDLQDKQGLVYDGIRKAFVNVDLDIAGGGASRLGQLLDVADSVDNPLSLNNGQSLVYNSLTNLWTNQFIDYNTLTNKPPVGSTTFIGLTDTASPAIPGGYVVWNSSATELVYTTSISASSITGLAQVATSGNFNDLSNKPTSSSYAFQGLSDTAKPPVANAFLKWNGAGTQIVYTSTIPATQISGLSPVATLGTLGSLTNLLPSVDTLNGSSDVGKILGWNGSKWAPATVTASTYVANNLTDRNLLNPTLGDQCYVINSDDGNGNNVGEWSQWIFTGSGPSNGWVLLASEISAESKSSTIQVTFGYQTPNSIVVGPLSSGGRVTLITIEVLTPFDGFSTIEVGYTINNPITPETSINGLMTVNESDLATAGVYSAVTDLKFGQDTAEGDITITASRSGTSTVGVGQITVSYV